MATSEDPDQMSGACVKAGACKQDISRGTLLKIFGQRPYVY